MKFSDVFSFSERSVSEENDPASTNPKPRSSSPSTAEPVGSTPAAVPSGFLKYKPLKETDRSYSSVTSKRGSILRAAKDRQTE